MTTTRNGWTAGPAARVAITAPGCADTGNVRAGDVATVMQALARMFDAEVEPLAEINGYRTPAYNASVGGDPNSNHISATALDLNGSRHPYEPKLPASQRGANYRHGFTAAQVVTIRKILACFDGVIAWGLDFNKGYRDAMHFEIRGSAAAVALAAAKLAITTTEDDMAQIRWVARLKGTPEQYVGDLVTRRHIPTTDDLNDMVYQVNVANDAPAHLLTSHEEAGKFTNPRAVLRNLGEVAHLDWLGVDVATLGTPGATVTAAIDYAALAKAVNDDAARRLSQ